MFVKNIITPQAGLEPTTFRLTVEYSSQLNYQGCEGHSYPINHSAFYLNTFYLN